MSPFSYTYSIPYVLFFICICVLSIPLIEKNRESLLYQHINFIQLSIFISLFIVFFGLRGYIYTDWASYYSFYQNCPSLLDNQYEIKKFINNTSWESGFVIYTIICKTISADYFFFQFISFTIDFIALFLIFKKLIPRHIMLGFIIFILFGGLSIEINLLRNSKSIICFMLSLKYIESKSIFKFFALNIFGCLFHITSLLYLPLYFILNKTIPKKLLIILFITGNIVYLFEIEWFRQILLLTSSFAPSRLEYLIEVYLSNKLYSSSYGLTLGFLERFISFLLIYKFSTSLCNIQKVNKIYINSFFIYLFIFLYFSEMTILLERIALLFVFSYWILFPQVFALLSKTHKKIFFTALFYYGIAKLVMGHHNIITLYDNVLFSYKSFSERLFLLTKHANKI